MQKIKTILLTLILCVGFISNSFGTDNSRLMRFPDINNNLIAFVYAGDIWTVNADGGNARRLTSHEGLELFPKISPDGKWIAFSAEYAGTRQIYVMPSEGGKPKQLTYYNSVGMMPPRGGFDNIVLDWTPDSKNILFRGNRTPFGQRNGKYFTVSIEGGMEKPLQIVNGGIATFSPDAQKICFTPVDREFRTWKRYKGGRATELWVYDLQKDESEQITHFEGSDQWPVWEGDKIYFASDRDLKFNIYSYDTNSKEINQITHFTDFDVMWPSGQNGQIVFGDGGYLYKMDTQTGEIQKLTVNIHFDNPNLVSYFKNVKDNIHSFTVSPTGKRALFDARGDIFSVPAENGITQNLTQTQGVREIYPSWSPNGKYIAYYSDATGEYEIYLLENKKGAKPVQVTQGSSAWKYDSEWSPDSKYLLYSDRTLQLKLLDIELKKETIVDHATASEISDYSFSPDSKWIVYSKESGNGQSAVWVYNVTDGKSRQVTGDTFNDYNPVFSTDGNFLFFLSERDFNLDFSSFEFNYVYNNATRIYAVPLKADGPKLFKDKNDVEPVKESSDKSEKTKEDKTGEDKTDVKIDFEGIEGRIAALPEDPGNYRNLTAVEDGVLFIADGKLQKYGIKEEKSVEIMEGVRQALVAADNQTILYRSGRDFGIAQVKPGLKPGTGKLNLDDMEIKIDPVKEWNQIFNDGWRIYRDYFYVDNMHGVDWGKVRDRYSQLLPYVGHRADLDYILSEMVAESNTGHSYTNWGDFKKVDRVEGALPGAALVADKAAGRYKIAEIYNGENWNDSRRSPLTEQGVDVKAGDYLIAVNGHNVTLDDNPYRFFENQAGRKIELSISDKPDGEIRTSLIEPVASEREIKYLTWVNQRRALVDKLSNGRIGYIHVPNTSFEGNRELFRGMYAYHDKEALIIDDRYNGGGFIPDVMADLLDRKTLSYWKRNGLSPMKTPGIAHDGPKVMLINGYSSSGGDAFPYYFKKKGLGTLIGTRTWGGLVGISGNASLIDGATISVPQFGVFDENSQWIIEGVGVYPDIKVVDRPEQLAKDIDPGIEKAVEVLLKELKNNPVKKIKSPTPPDRSKWNEKDIK